MGYISQATAILITINSVNDKRVYLIQVDAERWVRHASAMETNRANKSMVAKWLSFISRFAMKKVASN
jgi:hypothetical protein